MGNGRDGSISLWFCMKAQGGQGCKSILKSADIPAIALMRSQFPHFRLGTRSFCLALPPISAECQQVAATALPGLGGLEVNMCAFVVAAVIVDVRTAGL